jgi:hypothetical protein
MYDDNGEMTGPLVRKTLDAQAQEAIRLYASNVVVQVAVRNDPNGMTAMAYNCTNGTYRVRRSVRVDHATFGEPEVLIENATLDEAVLIYNLSSH